MKEKKIKKILTKKALSKVPAFSAEQLEKALKMAEESRNLSAGETIILQQWKLVFDEDPPVDVHPKLLEQKLRYDLIHEEAKAKGVSLSERFMENYKAAMKLDLQGFRPDHRMMLELSMKTKTTSNATKEEIVEKKKAAVEKAKATKAKNSEGKPKGPGKGATWAELFIEQPKKLRTDAELAQEFDKRMGFDKGTTSEKEVVKARGFYNFGALKSDVPKPKTPLLQHKEEKDEEPKAKAKVKVKVKK